MERSKRLNRGQRKSTRGFRLLKSRRAEPSQYAAEKSSEWVLAAVASFFGRVFGRVFGRARGQK